MSDDKDDATPQKDGVQKPSISITPKKTKRIAPISKVPTTPGYEWLTENMLRHWRYNADNTRVNAKGEEIPPNGINQFGVFLQMNKRLWCDLDRLDDYIEHLRVTDK